MRDPGGIPGAQDLPLGPAGPGGVQWR